MPDALGIGLALVVLAHGVGHLLFLGPVVGLGNWAGQTGGSEALTDVLGEGAARAIAALTWSAVIGLFVAGVGGFFAGADWWRVVTLAAAGLSITGIAVFWDGIPTSNAVFALVTDIAIVAAVLIVQWPTIEIAGS